MLPFTSDISLIEHTLNTLMELLKLSSNIKKLHQNKAKESLLNHFICKGVFIY